MVSNKWALISLPQNKMLTSPTIQQNCTTTEMLGTYRSVEGVLVVDAELTCKLCRRHINCSRSSSRWQYAQQRLVRLWGWWCNDGRHVRKEVKRVIRRSAVAACSTNFYLLHIILRSKRLVWQSPSTLRGSWTPIGSNCRLSFFFYCCWWLQWCWWCAWGMTIRNNMLLWMRLRFNTTHQLHCWRLTTTAHCHCRACSNAISMQLIWVINPILLCYCSMTILYWPIKLFSWNGGPIFKWSWIAANIVPIGRFNSCRNFALVLWQTRLVSS